MSTNAQNAVNRALNRLNVACRDEITALEPAARNMGGERGARLRMQAVRRSVFAGDLATGVRSLGGTPAGHASYGARLSAALRSVGHLATGRHQGDDYVACARAAERTADAYAKALKLDLPGDVRFGVEQQYAEVDFDRNELRWLRWGGSLRAAPANGQEPASPAAATAPADSAEVSALGIWEQDGGHARRMIEP